MRLRTFLKLNETLIRITESVYDNLTDNQRFEISMNIQNTYIRDYVDKHKKEGTREEMNDLIMQWIEKYAEQFRNDLIAGDYDHIIKKTY
jgi:hypothetical protein|tara:strand:- start:336 stop:605 length:270 start_codon:yes stop_codon:yes gene_type:complete